MTTNDLHRRIAAALARIGSLTRSHGQHEAQAEGLSPLQARALTALLVRDQLRVGELAEELMVAYGTVSEAVSSLESKELVTKLQDPEEHRAVLVGLTRRGRNVARRVEGWPDDLLGPVVAELGTAAGEVLLISLVRLIQSLERKGLISTSRMCVNCRFFRPGGGKGKRPHYCDLLEAAIGGNELQVDCPDFEVADERQLQENAALFRSPP